MKTARNGDERFLVLKLLSCPECKIQQIWRLHIIFILMEELLVSAVSDNNLLEKK